MYDLLVMKKNRLDDEIADAFYCFRLAMINPWRGPCLSPPKVPEKKLHKSSGTSRLAHYPAV